MFDGYCPYCGSANLWLLETIELVLVYDTWCCGDCGECVNVIA